MTEDELKPAVRDTLEMLRSGRMIVSVCQKGKCGYVKEFDGRKIRDPEFPDRKMLAIGVWRLFEGGFIDQFGIPRGPQS